MSGLKPRGKPGGCSVEGHGHNGVRGYPKSAGPCCVCAEIPLVNRAYEKRQVALTVTAELEDRERG